MAATWRFGSGSISEIVKGPRLSSHASLKESVIHLRFCHKSSGLLYFIRQKVVICCKFKGLIGGCGPAVEPVSCYW